MFARSGRGADPRGPSRWKFRDRFQSVEKKRLIDKMRGTVERLQSLEREAGKGWRRARRMWPKGDVAAEARKELRTRRSELKDIEEASEVGLTELKRR